jgi:type IV fimbrial biogenesis protein FimT
MGNRLHIRQCGVTMIELITVIAIVAILAQVAAPSFVSSTQRMRLLSHATALSGTFSFARSEAMKRGLPVSVCVSANGATCLSNGAWESGWIVFTDPAGSGVVGTVLKIHTPLGGTDTIRASNAGSIMTFSRDGFANMASAVSLITFAIHTTPANSAATRCVAVTNIGRLSTQLAGAGSCS